MARLALMIALLASTCLSSPVPSRVFDPYYTRPTALVAPEQWLDKRSAERMAGPRGYNAFPQATPIATVPDVESRDAGRGGYNGPPVKDPPDVESDAVVATESVEARDGGRGGYNGVDKAPAVVGPDVVPTEDYKREAETIVAEPKEPQPRDPGRV
ncbi:hypothetical protein B0A48_13300 [Cryoendolithus antarcticus]|uniref:Uncharacterized protein n=1 Tax=Cryoendolithus antarcticus TaxID=1507870 RepID=A0A1V8SPH1_9PEZI|nr:hypothetical protein B0A48_13300 [Cryoendolithus antarcticus]